MLNYPVAYTTFVTDGTRKFDFWSARRAPIDDSVNRGAMVSKTAHEPTDGEAGLRWVSRLGGSIRSF